MSKRFGARLDKAAAAANEKPVTYGNARLPGGITNGVAKLTVVEMGEIKAEAKKNAGDPYIRFAGVVVSPASVVVDGVDVPVAGLQTSIMETLGDTETNAGKQVSFEEHVANACNEMKKLAGAEFDTADFEAAVANLGEAAGDPDNPIYFRFSTSKGKSTPEYPEPRVFENWYGAKGLENYSPPDATAGATQDDTDKAPPTRTVPPKAAPAANGKAPAAAAGKAAPVKVPPKPEPDPNPDGAADVDVDQLLADANAGNAEGLQEAAIAAGFDKDVVDAADSWDIVADMIRNGVPEEADAPAADTANPQVENVFYYKPKGAKKAIECEVTAVNAKKKTVTLKNLTDGKTEYKDVPFTALEDGPG